MKRLLLSIALIMTATAANADGVAYIDEPVGYGRLNVLLSDQVMMPDECEFDGKHGYLGRVSIYGPYGNETTRYDGCWRFSEDGNEILFATTYHGKPEIHKFAVSRFTPLQ